MKRGSVSGEQMSDHIQQDDGMKQGNTGQGQISRMQAQTEAMGVDEIDQEEGLAPGKVRPKGKA